MRKNSPALPGVCVCVWNFSKEVKLVPPVQSSAFALTYSDDMMRLTCCYLFDGLSSTWEQLRPFDSWFLASGTRFWYLVFGF